MQSPGVAVIFLSISSVGICNNVQAGLAGESISKEGSQAMKNNKESRKEAKVLTGRIYVPYPIEVILKIISWLFVIAIDIVECILAPLMCLGIKSFCVFAVFASVYSGYMFFSFDLLLREALLLNVLLLALFLVLVCITHLLQYVLTKLIRPPFARIVFESVAVSFSRPRLVKRNARRCLKRLLPEQKKGSAPTEAKRAKEGKSKDQQDETEHPIEQS